MKINPLGIQSYQQIARREPQQKPTTPEETPSQEVNRQPQPPVTETATKPEQLSRLAVKANGSYADYLSPEEREALDLLFSRFRDTERFGRSFNRRTADDPNASRLGQVIDIKV